MVTLWGYAQSGITISDTLGNPIPDKGTLVLNGTPDASDIVAYLWVKNTYSRTISVKAKKVEKSLVPGTAVNFCWNGKCYPPTTFVSMDAATMAPGFVAKDFTGHYAPSLQKGQTKAQYVFFDQSNPNDSVSINVDYNTFPAGVEELAKGATLSGVYPNPANNVVSMSYTLPSGSDGSVIIRNILGLELKRETLESTSGRVVFNVADLSEGIYFSTLLVNGGSAVTRKLIVRH